MNVIVSNPNSQTIFTLKPNNPTEIRIVMQELTNIMLTDVASYFVEKRNTSKQSLKDSEEDQNYV